MDQPKVISDELWNHLVKINELLKNENAQKTLNNNKIEIENLRRENQILKSRNRELEKKLNQIDNEGNNYYNTQLQTQDTILSGTGSDKNSNQLEHRTELITKQNNTSQRILLTQDTILSDTEPTPNLDVEAGEDLDLTDVSPIKSEVGTDDNSYNYTESTKCVRRRLFSDNLNTTNAKKIRVEILSDDPYFDVSQVDDSQDCDLPNNNPIVSEKINLTKNPKFHRFWYPEDFTKNPEYEKFVGDRAVNIKSLPKFITEHYERQQAHIKSVALKDFHNLTTYFEDKENNDTNPTKQTGLITPVQNPDLNYKNPEIAAVYKFEINKTNLSKYLKFYPNLLRTKKVRDWDIEDSLSEDKCSDFLLTQDVQKNNLKAIEKSQIKALRMLFQACFIVENGKQVGRYIFRNNDYNEKVIKSEFLIDIGIFKD